GAGLRSARQGREMRHQRVELGVGEGRDPLVALALGEELLDGLAREARAGERRDPERSPDRRIARSGLAVARRATLAIERGTVGPRVLGGGSERQDRDGESGKKKKGTGKAHRGLLLRDRTEDRGDTPRAGPPRERRAKLGRARKRARPN